LATIDFASYIILGGEIMKEIHDYASDIIESQYENIRKEALKNLSKYKSNKIQVKSFTNRVISNQYLLNIKDDKLREDIVFKLENNVIPFAQNGNVIHTTISGTALACGLMSEEKLSNLCELEKEIERRTVEQFGLDTVVRIDNNKDFRWGSTGEKLSNTYFFKTLSDCEDSLKNGYIKTSYELLNIPNWHIPTTMPNRWELPNTMKPVIEPEDKSPTIIIDGGDELAMALTSSGLPELVAYSIQATLLYPFFLSALRIGYDGSSDEEKEHKELLEENVETKKELRKLLIASLVREIKLKEELKSCFDNGKSCKENSQTYKLISALSKEGVLRENLGNRKEELSNESILLIKQEANKIEKEMTGIISKETLENLSDKKFFNEMILNGNIITKSQDSYVDFVRNLSEWKQASDKTFIRKLQRYLETQVLKAGMGWMWTALAAFEANAIMNTFSSAGVKMPAREAVDTVLDSAAGILASAGQAAMVVYGISKTYGGVKSVMSLNEWINKINQSKLLDKSSKQLITDYLKSRRVHTILGECVGSSLLSAGQLMMVLGGPAAGFGSALTFPGAGITILGVVITLTNNVISANKFHIIDAPNKEESKILNDNDTVIQEGSEKGESEFLANLRWKMDSLKDISENAQERLLWINIYSEIIKNCDGRKKPSEKKELEDLTNKIIKKIQNLYSCKFEANMKNLAKEFLQNKEAKMQIMEGVQNFFDDRERFYHNITHNVVSGKNYDIVKEFSQNTKYLDDLSNNPKCSDIISLLDELKENRLWPETERKLIKRLVIKKKSEKNIRGSYFKDYVKTIPIKQDRNVEIPSPIPLVDVKFINPIVPQKSKTIYVFKADDFIEDLKNYSKLPPSRRKVLDEIIDSLIKERGNAVGRAITTDGNLKIKSEVYRPLWLEIPQLVYQEQLDRKINKLEVINDASNKEKFVQSKAKTRVSEFNI
jgi:hypothetical protein